MSEDNLNIELLPNFLIVGAAKSATTTIHEYLKEHPNVFMTEWKEPSFFVFKDKSPPTYTTDIKVKFCHQLTEYYKIFEKGTQYKIKGESSTPYLYFYHDTIKNIKEVIKGYSELKILIVLRNPVDRAYSQFSMKVRDCVEELTFEEAVDIESKRKSENAHFDFFYIDRGLYYEQVKAYLNNFKNVKIILFEDFKANENLELNNIGKFLGIDKHDFLVGKKLNKAGVSKFRFITKFIRSKSIVKRLVGVFLPKEVKKKIINFIMNRNLKKGEPINIQTRLKLQNFYKEDIQKLETLIQRDLSHWYN